MLPKTRWRREKNGDKRQQKRKGKCLSLEDGKMESKGGMAGLVTQGKEGLQSGGASTPLHSSTLFFFKEEGWKVKRVWVYSRVSLPRLSSSALD